MKKTIVLISVLILIFSINLLSSESKPVRAIPESKIIDIAGRVNAIMTDIPSIKDQSQGMVLPFIKVKIKDDKTGLEHSVQIAPGNFLRLNGVFLKKDDPIKVKAFKLDNSLEIRSLEINVKGKVLKLRDNFGKGLWEKPQNVRKEKKPIQK